VRSLDFLIPMIFTLIQLLLKKIASAFEDESLEACFGDLVYITQDNRREVRYWKSKSYVAKDFE